MKEHEPFTLQRENLFVLPTIHYNMEMAAAVHLAALQVEPGCIAVELPETMQLQLLHAASRLPDISILVAEEPQNAPLYLVAEPCEACFEALRYGLERGISCHCIDLDVHNYPSIRQRVPDPYAITRIGHKRYYTLYKEHQRDAADTAHPLDTAREQQMAKRLKELCLRHERVLFVCGMDHVEGVLSYFSESSFPHSDQIARDNLQLCTLCENSCRDLLMECGYISEQYELWRNAVKSYESRELPNRQQWIYALYKQAAAAYSAQQKTPFAGYHFRNLMKFLRNYALISGQLMPDLFQILTTARGCVDHNFAYETWELATRYPHLRNVDNLPELSLSIDEVYGNSRHIRFHLRKPQSKGMSFQKRSPKGKGYTFSPLALFGICSYQPEDKAVEAFGDFLRKKGVALTTEQEARTVPFTTSLEDGLDSKETIRHFTEHKLYVKMRGRPPGAVGSIVVIFEEDKPDNTKKHSEEYPWKTTWLGEHNQESDMAFYATPIGKELVGPGISRSHYGGFLMSYPPRRLVDVWCDPDYTWCQSKPELLLAAAIDYARDHLVVYAAATPPRSFFKQLAARYGKKLIYIPLGQLSPLTLRKIRTFHVLDSKERRDIADEYIF